MSYYHYFRSDNGAMKCYHMLIYHMMHPNDKLCKEVGLTKAFVVPPGEEKKIDAMRKAKIERMLITCDASYTGILAKCFLDGCSNIGTNKYICSGCCLARYCSIDCFCKALNSGHSDACDRSDKRWLFMACNQCDYIACMSKDVGLSKYNLTNCMSCHEKGLRGYLKKATAVETHYANFRKCCCPGCENDNVPGMVCSGCYQREYCSKVCFKEAWKLNHKKECWNVFQDKTFHRCNRCNYGPLVIPKQINKLILPLKNEKCKDFGFVCPECDTIGKHNSNVWLKMSKSEVRLCCCQNADTSL